jgi:hypothetical protein
MKTVSSLCFFECNLHRYVPAVIGRDRRTTAIITDEPTWFMTLEESDYQGTEWEQLATAVRKRMDFLCRLPCFNGATLSQLNAVAETLTEHRFEPGTTIMNQVGLHKFANAVHP